MKLKLHFYILPFIALTWGILGISKQSNAQTFHKDTAGIQDGSYYLFLKDADGAASLTLGPAGHYTAEWKDIMNFRAGFGWANGSPSRVINFKGTFNFGTNGFLAVYGWTKSDLVEYIIVENYGLWTPPGGVSKGTFISDSGVYNIYLTYQRHGMPNNGINMAPIYWSVRTTRRSSGTVTFANHVAAWKDKLMNLGTIFDYQIMLLEGYQSSGNLDITFSDGGAVTDVISDISLDDAPIMIHSNPVTDHLNFSLPFSQSPAEVSLMSLTGAQTLTWKTEKTEVNIDMSKYDAGIYLLKVVTDGHTGFKKIVKE